MFYLEKYYLENERNNLIFKEIGNETNQDIIDIQLLSFYNLINLRNINIKLFLIFYDPFIMINKTPPFFIPIDFLHLQAHPDLIKPDLLGVDVQLTEPIYLGLVPLYP